MLKLSPPLGLLEQYVLSTTLSAGACLCVKLVSGFGSALRRLAPSEPVAESSERVSYSSGAAAPFRSFLSEVGPSVARLASWGTPSPPMRRELFFSKRRGLDTGWGWEGGPVTAAARLSGGKGSPRGVTEETTLLCSSGEASFLCLRRKGEATRKEFVWMVPGVHMEVRPSPDRMSSCRYRC